MPEGFWGSDMGVNRGLILGLLALILALALTILGVALYVTRHDHAVAQKLALSQFQGCERGDELRSEFNMDVAAIRNFVLTSVGTLSKAQSKLDQQRLRVSTWRLGKA